MGKIVILGKRSSSSSSFEQTPKSIPRSSDKELGGVIFMANKNTMEDCFRFGVFGLPKNRWNIVQKVAPGLPLFLFEYEARELWGIFEASSRGSLNIEKAAYKSSGGAFPAQVRFTTSLNCPPLLEFEFREAIRDNYYCENKFNFDLTNDQVRRLCEIFCSKCDNLNSGDIQEEELLPKSQGYNVQEDRFLMDISTSYNREDESTVAGSAWGPNLYRTVFNSRHGEVASEPGILPRVEFGVPSDKNCIPYGMDGRMYADSLSLQMARPFNDVSPRYRTNCVRQDAGCSIENLNLDVHQELYAMDQSFAVSNHSVGKDLRSSRVSEQAYECDFSLTRPAFPVICDKAAKDTVHDVLCSIRNGYSRQSALPSIPEHTAQLNEIGSSSHGDRTNGRASVWSRLSARSKEVGHATRSSPKRRRENLSYEQDNSRLYVGNKNDLCPEMDKLNLEKKFTELNTAADSQIEYSEEDFVINYRRRRNSTKLSESGKPDDTEVSKRRKLIRPDFSSSETTVEDHACLIQDPVNKLVGRGNGYRDKIEELIVELTHSLSYEVVNTHIAQQGHSKIQEEAAQVPSTHLNGVVNSVVAKHGHTKTQQDVVQLTSTHINEDVNVHAAERGNDKIQEENVAESAHIFEDVKLHAAEGGSDKIQKENVAEFTCTLPKIQEEEVTKFTYTFSKDGINYDGLNSDAALCCQNSAKLQPKDLYPLGGEKQSAILDTATLETVDMLKPSKEAEHSKSVSPTEILAISEERKPLQMLDNTEVK